MQMPWTMAVVASLGVVACGKPTPQVTPAPLELPSIRDDTPEAEAPEVPEAAEVPEAVKFAVPQDARPAFDEAAYEAALIDHASCELKPHGLLDLICPGAGTIRDAWYYADSAKVMERTSSALGKRLLSHASPSVRVKAADVLVNVVTPSEADENALVAAARRETNTAVLAGFIAALRHNGAKNPEVADLILWAADHDDSNVRLSAVTALSTPANREIKGGVEKLIAIVETDPETWLRDRACHSAGNLGDAKLMPMYRKLTADRSDEERYGSCLAGLAAMWWSYPEHLAANAEAYRLTLRLLSEKPRSGEHPHWTVFSIFEERDAKNFAAWRARAPWYNEADFKSILAEIILDKDVLWLGRISAVKGFAGISTKDELNVIFERFPKTGTFEDSYVFNALRDAIALAE